MNKEWKFKEKRFVFKEIETRTEKTTNEKGEEILYKFKKGVRFKPLEYFCEDLTIEALEEEK